MKIFTILFIITLGSSNLVYGKTAKTVDPVLSPTIEIIGKYIKADKKFVYIKPNSSRNIIKLQRGFMLNSPSSLRKGMKVRYKVPLIAILEANKKLLSQK